MASETVAWLPGGLEEEHALKNAKRRDGRCSSGGSQDNAPRVGGGPADGAVVFGVEPPGVGSDDLRALGLGDGLGVAQSNGVPECPGAVGAQRPTATAAEAEDDTLEHRSSFWGSADPENQPRSVARRGVVPS